MEAKVDWATHCREWELTGLSQKEYCAARGLSYWKFCEQRSLLVSCGLVKAVRQRGLKGKREVLGIAGESFLPIELSCAEKVDSQKWIEICLPHGIIVRIPCNVGV